MAGFGTSFDPNTTPDTGNGGGGLHPEGIFEFEIIESDVKPTSKGTGTMMSFTAQGTGNPDAPSDNKGKKVWGNINVTNDNAQAQAIGQAQLAALAAACGKNIGELEDTEQLHYLPMWAEVVHKPQMSKESGYKSPAFNDDGSPKMRAEFKRFMFEGMDEVAAAKSPPAQKAAPTPAPTPTPAPAATGSRPWAKKA